MYLSKVNLENFKPNNVSKQCSTFDFFDDNFKKSESDYKKIDFGSILAINKNITNNNFNEFDYKEPITIKPNKPEKVTTSSTQGAGIASEELQQYISDLIELNELLQKVNFTIVFCN